MSDRPGNQSGPGSRPGRRALFSGPYDSGLATGEGGDPPERTTGEDRSAASRPGTAGDEPRGRRAFFSGAAPAERTPGPAGADGPEIHAGITTVVVECRTCLGRTPMSLPGLAASLLPSLWLPTRPWPRLMRCPACQRVSWCRIEWPRLRGAD